MVLILSVSYSLLNRVTYIEVQELLSFDSVKPNTLKKITNQEDIKVIKKSFEKSQKISGATDMADPNYLLKMKNKEYYLWIDEVSEKATMMKKSDTHTIYTINSAHDILEIIK